ncbi:MAG TPA: hypothetical protein VLM76_11360 [Patescibacteria group bacterium]|nr:hypothetical protein [Patescibacteria group bacterium]
MTRRIAAVALAVAASTWVAMRLLLGDSGLQHAMSSSDGAEVMLLTRPSDLAVLGCVAIAAGCIVGVPMRIEAGDILMLAAALLAACVLASIMTVVLVGEVGLSHLPQSLALVSVDGALVLGGVVGARLAVCIRSHT